MSDKEIEDNGEQAADTPAPQFLQLQQLVESDRVLCNVSARSKKHCLEILSELLSRSGPEIRHEEVLSGLIERERLGCTCLSKGIAFPHCRIEGLSQPAGALMKLSEAVDFDNSSGDLVDLIFGIVFPHDADDKDMLYMRTLSEMMRDDDLEQNLRNANSSKELRDVLYAVDIEPYWLSVQQPIEAVAHDE